MRHVFFSFHYDDVWRANQVRNMWVAQGKTAAGFVDSAEFEAIRRQGDRAIKNWIDRQMIGTSVTVVLIGSETLSRPYVQYEIDQTIANGKGLLGIHINQLKDQSGRTKYEPTSKNLDKYNPPSSSLGILLQKSPKYETKAFTPSIFDDSAYNWIRDNIGDWIEEAARKVKPAYF